MTKETLTVHELLSEMKTIEKRIDKAISAIVPIAVKENAAKNVNAISIADFNDAAESEQQRAVDLIARYDAMKSALYKYNAEKTVTVAGQEMTVAHALWLMKDGMKQKRMLLSHYEKAYTKAVQDAEKGNGAALNTAAERAAEMQCGSKDKSNADDYMAVLNKYKESHQLVYVDPLNLKERINELSEEIETFMASVDARIQMANATTEVTIVY